MNTRSTKINTNQEEFIHYDNLQSRNRPKYLQNNEVNEIEENIVPRLQYESSEASHDPRNSVIKMIDFNDSSVNQSGHQYSFRENQYNGPEQIQKQFTFDPERVDLHNDENKDSLITPRKTLIRHEEREEEDEEQDAQNPEKQSPPSWISLAHLRSLTTNNQQYIDSSREQQNQDSFLLQTFDNQDGQANEDLEGIEQELQLGQLRDDGHVLKTKSQTSSQCQLSSQSINLEDQQQQPVESTQTYEENMQLYENSEVEDYAKYQIVGNSPTKNSQRA